MQDYSLNVLERLKLCSILPPEGSLVTLRMIRTLIGKLGLSAEEITRYEVVTLDPATGQVRWNEAGMVPVSIELEDAEIELIKKQLKDLDAKNKLTPDMVSACEVFNL